MVNVESINNCIACGHDNLIPVLDLKEQPLANSYKKSRDEVQETYPLAIVRCDKCYHVQLTHRVNPDLMFKDYLYVSGTAKSQLEYFDWFSQFVAEKFGTKPRTVLDVGCNDGSQLNYFQDYGSETFGVDPAENLYSTSSQRHEVVCGYFTGKEFSQNFDVIVCQNAFAHNYDQLELLQNIRNVMHKDSLLFATTSQSDMIVNGEFDTIYHEHLSFYNIKSINELCKRADLHLVDVVKSPVHGTSYIFIISKFAKAPKTIENLIALETKRGLYFPETYVNYYERCNDILKKFKGVVQEMKDQGITTVGLGAPAKGNTLLNAAETSLDFIIDENPLKQGLFTPGSSVPIYGMNHLDNYKYFDKICFIPLAWNFYSEMKRKVQAYRGGKKDIFVKYFPEFSIEK